MAMERQEFRGTRTRVQHGILLSAFLALVGLASLYFAGPTVRDAGLVGAVALCLSAAVLIVVLRNLRDLRPRMVLDREGIWFRDWEIEAVSWAAVRDAYRSGSRVQTFITIRLRDGEHFLAGLPEAERTRLKTNRLFRLPELRIPHNALDAPHDTVLATINSAIESSRHGDAPGAEA